MNPVLVNQDEEHLKLLSIFHYVLGGLTALMGCLGLLYLFLGLVFMVAPSQGFGSGANPPPPALFGFFFAFMGGVFLLLGWTIAALIILAGRSIARRKHHTFCLVTAAICCLQIPFGTALGVFTFIVLLRPSVKLMFAPAAPR